jgi:hypothetical protein
MALMCFSQRTSWIPDLLAGMLLALAFGCASAPPARAATAEEVLVWTDIRELGVEGRGWNETKAFYDRLPAKAEGTVRPPVWSLSRHSAGMHVRFVTDSSVIHARWALTARELAMPHMAATGVSGLDLYAKTDSGQWHWLAVGRPTSQTNTQALVNLTFDTRRLFSWPPADFLGFPRADGQRSSLQF